MEVMKGRASLSQLKFLGNTVTNLPPVSIHFNYRKAVRKIFFKVSTGKFLMMGMAGGKNILFRISQQTNLPL